ncbi:MAG: hypothetical protein LBF17_00520 [Mediterranea sp.]|jgi:hypothetical protein|nr:hypothetical protein [Mediterranea sp.]
MEDIFQIVVIIGLIIFFAVIRRLMASGEEGKERRRRPVTLSEDNEVCDNDHFTFSAKIAERQHSKKQIKRSEPSVPPPVREEPDDAREFDIHSAEEVRRAVIWSEILNRKY